jgi:hypothetical protein
MHIIWLLLHIDRISASGLFGNSLLPFLCTSSNQQEFWIFDEGVWSCVVPTCVMLLLIVPYNVLCSSVDTVLCIVFLLQLHPLNLLLKMYGMLNRKHPKTPCGCSGRFLAAVGAALCTCIELSVGPAVSNWPLQTQINPNCTYRPSPYRAVNTPVSVIKIGQLMLYREIIAVCSEIHTEHTNTAVWAERGIAEC